MHWISLNVDAAWDKREACLARNSSGAGLKAWTKKSLKSLCCSS